jgi:hypothetical protein
MTDPDLVAERDRLLAGLGDRPPWYRPFRRRLWGQRRRAILAMDVSRLGRILRDVYTAKVVEELASRVSCLSTPVRRRDTEWLSAVYPVTKDDLP